MLRVIAKKFIVFKKFRWENKTCNKIMRTKKLYYTKLSIRSDVKLPP